MKKGAIVLAFLALSLSSCYVEVSTGHRYPFWHRRSSVVIHSDNTTQPDQNNQKEVSGEPVRNK